MEDIEEKQKYVYNINQIDEYFDWIVSKIKNKFKEICGVPCFMPHSPDPPQRKEDLERKRPKSYIEAVERMRLACDVLKDELINNEYNPELYHEEIVATNKNPVITIRKNNGNITIDHEEKKNNSKHTYLMFVKDPFSMPRYEFINIIISNVEIPEIAMKTMILHADKKADEYYHSQIIHMTEAMWSVFDKSLGEELANFDSSAKIVYSIENYGIRTWGAIITNMKESEIEIDYDSITDPITIEIINGNPPKISNYLYGKRSWNDES
jgi:hypothetical protein